MHLSAVSCIRPLSPEPPVTFASHWLSCMAIDAINIGGTVKSQRKFYIRATKTRTSILCSILLKERNELLALFEGAAGGLHSLLQINHDQVRDLHHIRLPAGFMDTAGHPILAAIRPTCRRHLCYSIQMYFSIHKQPRKRKHERVAPESPQWDLTLISRDLVCDFVCEEGLGALCDFSDALCEILLELRR